MTQREITLTRLVAANGMKSNDEWEAMSHLERVAWVDSLDLVHVRAQASIRALAAKCTVEQVLTAWRLHGYLSTERAAQVLDARARA